MAENSVASIMRTVGNYLGFANKSFPIDAEGLTQTQYNEKLLSVLGNIGGNKYILMGCTPATGYAGFVFLATADNPQGELLYLEEGTLGSTIYLDKSTVNISASGYDYEASYTQRKLAWGLGVENFNWSEFKKLETNSELSAKIAAMQTTIDGIVPEAVGSMKFWAGPLVKIPTNWVIMDGASLLRADYPALFAVIGTTYGSVAETHFNLPSMLGRFPVAYNTNSGDTDFSRLGLNAFAGEKAVTLTTPQLPSHEHTYIKENIISNGNFNAGGGAPYPSGSTVTASSSVGGDQSHNNLPPYHVFPFIIKVK